MPYAITSDGTKLYFEECGEGQPIIFLHEFAGDYRSFEPQMRRLSRNFRCVAFNARGFPPSDVPKDQDAYSQPLACADVLAIMDHLDIRMAHLIGVSMGAFTGLFTALDYSVRVKSLIVAGCGFGASLKSRDQVVKDIEEAATNLATSGMAKFADTYAHGPARIQFKLKDPRGWLELKTRLAEHSEVGAAMTLRGVQRDRPMLHAVAEKLARLATPVLIVTGDEDDHCLEPSLFLKRTLPNAGLAIFPHTGHTVNLEEPDAFNRLCIDFIEAVDRGARRGRHELALRSNAFGTR